jgi:hypothetical protein
MSDYVERELTPARWGRIIGIVRAETGPGFQISMEEMRVILREFEPLIAEHARQEAEAERAEERDRLYAADQKATRMGEMAREERSRADKAEAAIDTARQEERSKVEAALLSDEAVEAAARAYLRCISGLGDRLVPMTELTASKRALCAALQAPIQEEGEADRLKRLILDRMTIDEVADEFSEGEEGVHSDFVAGIAEALVRHASEYIESEDEDESTQPIQEEGEAPKTFAELRDRFVDPEKEKLRAEVKRFRDRCTHPDTTLNGDGTMTCDLCGLTEPDPFAATPPQPIQDGQSSPGEADASYLVGVTGRVQVRAENAAVAEQIVAGGGFGQWAERPEVQSVVRDALERLVEKSDD